MRITTNSLLSGKARKRRTVLLSVAVVLLVPAAIAWACNPQAHMKCGGAQGCQVAPGGSLNVSGTYFQTNTDLALSLDSGGAVTTVKTNAGGAFSTTIQAPSQPGSYTLLAKRSDGAARSGLPARLSFEVTSSSSATPSPTAQPPASAAPQAQQGPAFNEPSVNRSPAQERSSSGGREGSGTPGDSPAARTPSSGGSDGTAVTQDDAGRDVFGGSVAPTGGSTTPSFASPSASPTTGSQAEPSTGTSGRSSGTPSEQAAAGDVWSGFGSGSSASLMPNATDAAPDGGTGSGFGWGIGLLALGLLALVSGVAVAEVRRRRALAGS